MGNQKKNLCYWAISVLLAACILALCLCRRPNEKVDIVFLGDSIIGNASVNTHCVDVVAERTGMTVFNGGFGGTCMSFGQSKTGASEPALWCMAELAEAICYKDFGTQKAAIAYGDHYREINRGTLDYFKARMDALAEIDFSQVKVLIIEHGTNDYNAGIPLDNEENLYDKNTFAGALRSSLRLLTETYPDLRIIVMTPIYCELGVDREDKCYNTNYGGGTLDEYVEKEKEIAAEFGVELLDAYHDSGISEENAVYYLPDGMHPVDEGHALLGNLLADYLLK